FLHRYLVLHFMFLPFVHLFIFFACLALSGVIRMRSYLPD
ncbi:hypothetical protein HMPREF1379_00616, partial [Enterococcus faecium R497]